VVAAVHYYATAVDHAALLDYLGEPNKVILHPWPVIDSPPRVLTRTEALAAEQVMIVHHELGQPSLIGQGHPALTEPTRAGVFNQLNWERLRPTGGQGLVDSNTSPVLFWNPAKTDDAGLRAGNLGSQADAMLCISSDYERWVKRVMGWVRRRGTKVWGWRGSFLPVDVPVDSGGRPPVIDEVFDDHEGLVERDGVVVVVGVALPIAEHVPALLVSRHRIDGVFARIASLVKRHDQGAGPVGHHRQQSAVVMLKPGLELAFISPRTHESRSVSSG